MGRSITSPQANRLTAAGKPNAITARGPKILEVVHEEHQRKVPRAGADRSFISVADKRISFLRIGEIRLVGVAKPAGRRRASGTWQTAGVLGSSALQRWHFGVSGPTSGGLAVGHVLRDRHLPCRDRHLPYRDGQAFLTASRWSSGTAQNAINRCEDFDCMKLLKGVSSDCYLT